LNQSTSSAADTLVSHSAKPVSDPEALTRGIFGRSSRESFAYFDPDTYSWKTSQATFLSDLETFSETWPDSGSMRSGRVFARQTSELPTCEKGSSSWLTPHGMHGTDHTGKTGRGGEFAKQSTNWPTARREDGESAGNHPGAVHSLTGATRGWATPNAHDGRRPGSDATSTQGANLKRDAEVWQTPATDSLRSRGGDRKDEMGLDQQARSHQAPVIHDGPPSSQSAPTYPRRLNPRFVEWLMGFPITWSEL
jgi:hypothetical protein